MALGGPKLAQTIVEFIPGDASTGGVYTNGVRDGTSTSGPWTFVVPDGVARLLVDACAGGSGGGGGGNTGTVSRGGGGGGAAGMSIVGFPLAVAPGASLSITCGAAGAAGAANANGGTGGDTIIRGTTTNDLRKGFQTTLPAVVPGIYLRTSTNGGVAGTNQSTATAAAGGAGARPPLNNATGTGGAGGTAGGNGSTFNPSVRFRFVYSAGGSGGGSGNATGTVNGGNGGVIPGRNGGGAVTGFSAAAVAASGGLGNSTGTISQGGGGGGAMSPFGSPGDPGTNGGSAAAGVGYGFGGSGGAGSGAGAAGGSGYVRFTFLRYD